MPSPHAIPDAIMPSATAPDVTVVGAGIVGLSAAFHLLRASLSVEVIDRDEPGLGASFGNAGLVSPAEVAPVAMPGIAWRAPAMLMDPLAPLTIRWRDLPSLAPWLIRFVLASRAPVVEGIAADLAALLRHALPAHRDLAGAMGVPDLLAERGLLYVYAQETARRAQDPFFGLLARNGVAMRDVPRDELRQIEPALGPEVVAGVHLPDNGHVLNPHRLVTTLAAAVAAAGGHLMRDRVLGVERDGARAVAVRCDGGRRPINHLVIAAGAHSLPLAADLGARVPLATERGYHLMLPDPGTGLRMPLVSGDHYFCITPMEHGLRMAGTVELASLDAPENWARADMLLGVTARYLPGLRDTGATRWMGRRPSMPDSKPVIGRPDGIANAVLAFGHGHLGLTMGPLTGRVVADLLTGRPPPFDLAPFAPDRF